MGCACRGVDFDGVCSEKSRPSMGSVSPEGRQRHGVSTGTCGLSAQERSAMSLSFGISSDLPPQPGRHQCGVVDKLRALKKTHADANLTIKEWAILAKVNR